MSRRLKRRLIRGVGRARARRALRTFAAPPGKRASRRFGRDRSGGIAIVSALALVILAASVGGAVDYGRWLTVKSQTQVALDASVLAASQILQTEPGAESRALDAASKAYLKMRARDTVVDDTTFEVAEGGSAVRAVGFATVATPFLATIGVRELEVNLLSETSFGGGGRGGSHIELSLMLDVTGSMCDDNVGPCLSGTKIDGLKAAAKDLVNVVVWPNQTNWTSRMALVPFSTRVRVGPDRGGGPIMRQLTNLEPTWSGWYKECRESTGGGGSEGGGNWACTRYEAVQKDRWPIMPCVTDRTGPDQYTDAAPAAQSWLNAHDGSRRMLSWSSIDDPLSERRGETSADPADHWNYDSSGGCSDVSARNEVMPLTSDREALIRRIDDVEAYGSTAGALGTAWSWYMLSDRWSGIWTGAARPRPYSELTEIGPGGKPTLRKVAVLMSDGVYNTFRGWKDQSQSMVSDRAKRVCAEMKLNGIEIYSVAFALDRLTQAERVIAEDTLKSCGTSLAHFYESLTVDQLKGAFRDIALKISTVRLAR
jgi:Flp pilus assembly protein TadG